MSDLAVQVTKVEVTDEQRERFLAQLRDDHATGLVAALRSAGVQGTKGQLRAFLAADEALQEDARLARGWNLNSVENVAWEVALDKDHPSWDRANARVLKAYHPAYRDQARVEHTGPGGGPLEVSSPDVAAAIERFTVTVRRLVERAQSGGAVRAPDTGAADGAVGELGP